MAKTTKNNAETNAPIMLQRIRDTVIEVSIVGVTPVIPHKWSEKSKKMMPGHPEKEDVKKAKGLRDAQGEAESCLYLLNGKPAMPATAFKAAIIGACRFFDRPSMVEAKQLIMVIGEGDEQLVAVGGRKVLREDTPRNATGVADLRYRYMLIGWRAKLRVSFCERLISQESIIALIDAAGRGGVGDWRPSAPKSYTGTYGTWRVDEEAEVAHVAQKITDHLNSDRGGG